MNVEKLIDELNKIDDKTQDVYVSLGIYITQLQKVTQEKENFVLLY